jgi:hypothetical protein
MLVMQRFVVNPIEESTYILHDDSKEAVVVDCGAFYPEEKAAIARYVKEHGLTV